MAPPGDGKDLDVNFVTGICALAKHPYDSSRTPAPNEIWYNIWHLMALDDRLAVTRVCKELRRLAHTQRSLWNRLDFRTSLHQRNCLCNRCNLVGDAAYSFDPDAEDWLWEVSNLHHAARVLPLSGILKLHVTLEVQVYDAPLDEIYTLGVAMALHAERIATLSIRTADSAAYYTFLARFESLPNLRSFSGVLMGNSGRRPYGASFVPAALQVPELQTVRLSRGFCFPTPQIGRTFPTGRDIAIAPAMNISAEVSQALGACPNLDAFALDLHAFARPAPSDDTAAAIQRRASALRSVTVSGIRLEFEQWLMDALAHPMLQILSLGYDSPSDISLGWSIFAALTLPLTLRVSMKNYWPECDYPTSDSVFCMEIEDATRRTRRVAVHHCAREDARAALEHIGARWPHTVVAPYALWPLVRAALGLSALSAAALVVSASDAEDRAEVTVEDGALSLRALTLIYDGHGSLSLPSAPLEQLVRRAHVRLPLDVLTLDRRLAAAVPDGLARTIVVTPCSPPAFPIPAPLRDTTRYEPESASEDSDLDDSD